MYALEYGPYINESNLVQMTGSIDYVRPVDNYTDIAQMIGNQFMDQAGCKVHPIPPCQKLDCVFILDSSGSIGAKNYDKVKSFATNIAQQMIVSPTDVQFGMVQFESEIVESGTFVLDKYESNDALVAAIAKSKWSEGGTCTGCALERVQKWVDDGSGGFRDGVNRAIILFSDGESNRGDNPVTVSGVLRSLPYSFTVLTVGVPESDGQVSKAGYKELLGIAGNDPSKEFNITDYDQLNDIITDLNNLLPCGDDNFTTTAAPPTKATFQTQTIPRRSVTQVPIGGVEGVNAVERRRNFQMEIMGKEWKLPNPHRRG